MDEELREGTTWYAHRWGGPIHEATGERTASVQALTTKCGERMKYGITSTAAPEQDPYECWITGWRPCFNCFPAFDRATWKRLRLASDAALEADNGEPDGRAYAAFWDSTWAAVYQRRAQSAALRTAL